MDDACSVDAISTERQLSPADVAGKIFPVWTLTDAESVDVGHGKKVECSLPDAPLVAAIHDSRLAAIVSVVRGVARVVAGFPHD